MSIAATCMAIVNHASSSSVLNSGGWHGIFLGMSSGSKEPLDVRLVRYRNAAQQARRSAQSATTDEARACYNSIAMSWESLIAETESAIKDAVKNAEAAKPISHDGQTVTTRVISE